MKFKKKKTGRKISRSDADIMAAKIMFDNRCNGIEAPLSYYDKVSDNLCGKPSRQIYEEGK